MPRYEDDDRPRRRSHRRDEEDEEEDDIPVRKPRSEANTESNGYALTSMILGLVGFCVPLICGLLAMLFGIFGLNRSKVTGTGKGMAITGIILGFLNGIVAPSIGGYIGYRMYVEAKRVKDQIVADREAAAKKRMDEQKAIQKKWDDDEKERQRKQAEESKKWEEQNKIAAAKREEERLQREAESKARQEEFARKMEEDRLKREMEQKERMAKFEEDRKKREEENKLNGEIAKARTEISQWEIAVRAYTIRNKNKPPASLQVLVTPPAGGGQPFLNPNSPLKDPWGQDYQYDPANKNLVGGLDPLVFTVHPKTGEKILASNRK